MNIHLSLVCISEHNILASLIARTVSLRSYFDIFFIVKPFEMLAST